VHDTAATRGQYLALSKAWWSCFVTGSFTSRLDRCKRKLKKNSCWVIWLIHCSWLLSYLQILWTRWILCLINKLLIHFIFMFCKLRQVYSGPGRILLHDRKNVMGKWQEYANMVAENTICDVDSYVWCVMVFTVRLGQGLGSCNVSVSVSAYKVSCTSLVLWNNGVIVPLLLIQHEVSTEFICHIISSLYIITIRCSATQKWS